MRGINSVYESPLPDIPALPPLLFRMLPWLKLLGAFLAFVVISLHSAIDSELGRPLTIGESPVFSMAKAYPGSQLVIALGYLLLVLGLQILSHCRSQLNDTRSLQLVVGSELAAVGIIAASILLGWDRGVPLGHTVLQGSIIGQVFLTIPLLRPSERRSAVELLDLKSQTPLLFLSLFFLFAAVLASLNPSQRNIGDYVQLDSSLEVMLIYILPPLLSGITGL